MLARTDAVQSGRRSILLGRMGIARYPNIPAASRKKVSRILRELWRAGKLVRRVDLNRDHDILEASYMRPEDKPLLYFEACDKCGFPRFVRYGRPTRAGNARVSTLTRTSTTRRPRNGYIQAIRATRSRRKAWPLTRFADAADGCAGRRRQRFWPWLPGPSDDQMRGIGGQCPLGLHRPSSSNPSVGHGGSQRREPFARSTR